MRLLQEVMLNTKLGKTWFWYCWISLMGIWIYGGYYAVKYILELLKKK